MVHQSIWYHIVLGSLLWAASHMISYTQRGKCMAQSSGKALYNCVGSARLTGYYAHANFITLFMTPLTSANIPGSPRVYISRSGEPGNEARDLRRSWSFSKCSNLDSTVIADRTFTSGGVDVRARLFIDYCCVNVFPCVLNFCGWS